MLAPIQIDTNWHLLMKIVTDSFPERSEALLEFYQKHKDRIKSMPASSKKEYHSCFEGGYVHHVLNVIQFAKELAQLWIDNGTAATFTMEEVVFAALNHDLGKMGDEDQPFYLKNTSEWHIKNQGKLYEINTNLKTIMPVPHRSIFLLQSNGIWMSSNEMIAIMTHDGLYSEGNKEYLMGYNKPTSSLCYIIHQADIMASRIEYEQQNLVQTERKVTASDLSKPIARRRKKNIQADLMDGKSIDGLTNVLNNIK